MLFFDFEVFMFDWMVVVKDTDTRETHAIVNDPDRLRDLYSKNKNNIWCGYNVRHYDQYIFKAILLGFDPYDVSRHIIEKHQGGWSYSDKFRDIPLFTYDIMTSFHSLKQLEGFMGNDIRESTVSFNISRRLTSEEIEEVLQYCNHDVEQTMEVFMNRIEEFESHVSNF